MIFSRIYLIYTHTEKQVYLLMLIRIYDAIDFDATIIDI